MTARSPNLLAAAIALFTLLSSIPAAPQFSHYLLVLSYAPDFCAQPQGKKDPRECGAGRRVGFIVHGLWPQNETSRGPQNCGPASPVSKAIVQTTLKYIPTESLMQHEWDAHGTCSGLSAADYFAALRKGPRLPHSPGGPHPACSEAAAQSRPDRIGIRCRESGLPKNGIPHVLLPRRRTPGSQNLQQTFNYPTHRRDAFERSSGAML